MKTKFAALLLAAVLVCGGAAFADKDSGSYDAQIQTEVNRQLQSKSQFKDVQATVEGGVVTLQGSVDTLQHKLDAEKRARKQDHVAGVRDLVQVAGNVSDAELREQLARKLRYDRYGMGIQFNYVSLDVKNGVAILGGEVRNPVDRDSTVAEVVATPGVKDLVNNIKVAPVSFADDELRWREERAIYGAPELLRYAMDPQAPIRIVVDNGHVGLYGMVNSEFDRILAGLRAGQVFGAFSVENHLLTPKDVAR